MGFRGGVAARSEPSQPRDPHRSQDGTQHTRQGAQREARVELLRHAVPGLLTSARHQRVDEGNVEQGFGNTEVDSHGATDLRVAWPSRRHNSQCDGDRSDGHASDRRSDQYEPR